MRPAASDTTVVRRMRGLWAPHPCATDAADAWAALDRRSPTRADRAARTRRWLAALQRAAPDAPTSVP